MDDALPPSDGLTLPTDRPEEGGVAVPVDGGELGPASGAVGGGAGEPPETSAVPPVVAVVVARDPGPWLEEGLRALGASEYPDLTVLVMDTGSTEDLTPRVASVLPGAFVRRLADGDGFAAAANDALQVVTGATFLLLCHDDVALDPSAIRLLVEEAYRSNAAIVGPKLVDYEHPELLLEVGQAIDRFGVPHSGIEPGELDQEQHDAVRDVFYVSDAVMLVRADLLAELGGFDRATFPGGEDLDLCWRARLAGARVMVAPDARARHREAGALRSGAEPVGAEVLQRNRLRAMLKCYSTWSLVYVIPLAMALHALEAIAFLFTRRRARARALVAGWTWNLRHLSEIRASRRATQALRRVPDSELRPLQVRGSARVRGYVVGSLQAEDRLRSLSERSRTAASSASSGVRSPIVIAVLVFAFGVLVGSRELLLGRVSAVGQLPEWPGVGELVASFTSAWRFTDLGSASSAPPLLAGFSALGAVLLGATGLARTIVVVGALPLGVLGTWRLARSISGPGWAAAAAGLVYGLNPLPRNAIAQGRLGPLVLYALAPFVMDGLLRASGYFPELTVARWWRGVVGTAALVALTTAVWPPAVMLPLVVVVAFTLVAVLVGDRRLGALASRGLGATIVGAVLLVPWPSTFLQSGDRLGAIGFAFPSELDLAGLLRFETGPNGAGAPGWAFLVVGLLALLLASGARLAWAARVWMVALVGFALAWIPARFFPDAPVPAVEGILVPAALGLALAAGLAVAAFLEDVRQVHFGWRQVASIAGALALAGASLAFAADALGGRWHQPDGDWVEELSWMDAQRSAGAFRVLWLGDPSVLPVDPVVVGGVGYGVTDDGPGDARTSLPPPTGGASALVGDAVELLRRGRSSRVGRLLAPMAVRYVAVPERPDPGLDRTAPAPPELLVALAGQLDLIRLEAPSGIVLYENRAWLPGAALLPADAVPAGVPEPLDAPADSSTVEPVQDGRSVPSGTVLWSEAYDEAWRATSGGRALEHTRAFGWANGFEHPRAGEVTFSYTRQWLRYPMLGLQLVIVVAAFLLWRGSARLRLRRRPRTEVTA